jgi:hypothetical protein
MQNTMDFMMLEASKYQPEVAVKLKQHIKAKEEDDASAFGGQTILVI